MSARLPVATRVLLQAPTALLALAAVVVGVLPLLPRAPSFSEMPSGGDVHGGGMVQVGSRQLELVREPSGQLRCYALSAEGTELRPIRSAALTVEVTPDGSTLTRRTALLPAPEPGDPPGTASVFTGTLPAGLAEAPVQVALTVPLDGRRYRARFDLRPESGPAALPPAMPPPAAVTEQAALYAFPGGRYTAADIRANGAAPAAEKYRGLLPDHHLRPARGERVCPITRTRANPRFAWTINGKRYLFCCPPCIDEFVKKAKKNTASIPAPESYVQR